LFWKCLLQIFCRTKSVYHGLKLASKLTSKTIPISHDQYDAGYTSGSNNVSHGQSLHQPVDIDTSGTSSATHCHNSSDSTSSPSSKIDTDRTKTRYKTDSKSNSISHGYQSDIENGPNKMDPIFDADSDTHSALQSNTFRLSQLRGQAFFDYLKDKPIQKKHLARLALMEWWEWFEPRYSSKPAKRKKYKLMRLDVEHDPRVIDLLNRYYFT
jgi:hypothetical protein